MYSLNSTQFTSIPILFFRQKLLCLNDQGQYYQCSLEDACKNPQGYVKQSDYPDLYNITMHLDMYCDREVLEAWIFSVANFGRIFGTIFLFFIPIKKDYKGNDLFSVIQWRFIHLNQHLKIFLFKQLELIQNLSSIGTGLSLFTLQWISTTYAFVVTFIIWYFFSTIFFGLVFSHLYESYPERFQSYGAALMCQCTPIVMIIYIVYSYYFRTWENTLIHFTAIPLFIVGCFGLGIQYITQKSEKEEKPFIVYTSPKNQIPYENSDLFPQQKKLSSDLTSNNTKTVQNRKQSKDLYQTTTQDQTIQNKTISLDSQDIDEDSQKYDNEFSIEQKPDSKTKQKGILQKFLPFLFNGSILRNNFYLFTLGFVCYVVNYYGIQFLLNTFQGDLFVNCFVSTSFELVSQFINVFLVVKYQNKLNSVIIITQIIAGLAFLSTMFIEQNSDQQQSEKKLQIYEILFLIFKLSPFIIAKICFEITPVILMTYQKYIIPVKYQQSQLSLTNLTTMVIINFIPFYKYYVQSIGFNPFIGFGFLSLLSAYQSQKFKVLQDSEINDMNVKVQN